MLVLQALDKQRIMLGTEDQYRDGTYTILTVFVDRHGVSVGIDAQPEIKILREKLVDGYIEGLK